MNVLLILAIWGACFAAIVLSIKAAASDDDQ